MLVIGMPLRPRILRQDGIFKFETVGQDMVLFDYVTRDATASPEHLS